MGRIGHADAEFEGAGFEEETTPRAAMRSTVKGWVAPATWIRQLPARQPRAGAEKEHYKSAGKAGQLRKWRDRPGGAGGWGPAAEDARSNCKGKRNGEQKPLEAAHWDRHLPQPFVAVLLREREASRSRHIREVGSFGYSFGMKDASRRT